MNASAHRANARDALKGNWVAAVVVSLIGSLFSASSNSSTGININVSGATGDYTSMIVPEYLQALLHDWLGLMMGTVVVISLVIILVQALLGGAVKLGVCRYHLNLIDRKPALIDDVLAGLPLFWKGFLMNLIPTLFLLPIIVLLFIGTWFQSIPLLLLVLVLLPFMLVIPFGFVMAPYILLEDPDCGPWESLKRSYKMMRGHKWEYFCLEFSFFGWSLLAAFTLGIGSLFLVPYVNTSVASFYRNLQNQGYAPAEDF